MSAAGSGAGVVVALAAECRSLGCRPRRGAVVRMRGTALLARAGVGMARATRAAEQLVEMGASALVSWGCAAALAADAEPGDLCLPLEVIDPLGLRLTVDKTWQARVHAAIGAHCRVRTGPIVTQNRVAAGSAEKRALAHTHTGADALDMESAAIAAVARMHDLPFLVVRAIADRRAFTLPASILAAADDAGEIRLAVLAARLARHPGDLPPLLELARDFRAARRTLARVARVIGKDFLLAAPA